MLERVIVWMIENIIAVVLCGVLIVSTFCNTMMLVAFIIGMTVFYITGTMLLKKKGYVFGSEDEEAQSSSLFMTETLIEAIREI